MLHAVDTVDIFCNLLIQRCSRTWSDYKRCSCSYCYCPLNILHCYGDCSVCCSVLLMSLTIEWLPTTSLSCLFLTSLYRERFVPSV